MINLNSTPLEIAVVGQDPVDGIEQHRHYLFNNALGRLRNRHAAEDAVQDSFLAALKNADRFSGNATPRTWLTGILKHKVCDQVRRSCRDRQLFESTELNDHDEHESYRAREVGQSTEIDPSAALEQKELRTAIQNAIAKLPDRLAKAFSLYECDDYNGREVCDALGITENNLWIMLHRARKQLQSELSAWVTGAAA